MARRVTLATMDLARTELDFLHRLLLDVQRRLGDGGDAADAEHVAALELALAMLQWNGEMPPELDAQLGLGAAVECRLGLDALCAWRQWRNERRKRLALTA